MDLTGVAISTMIFTPKGAGTMVVDAVMDEVWEMCAAGELGGTEKVEARRGGGGERGGRCHR